MKLSIREAATLMGRSPRTVRGQVARGALPGEKRNGRWYVDRRHLPLTESQRRTFQQKADSLRRIVDEALPARTASRYGEKHRSASDLDAFRLGSELLAEIRETSGTMCEVFRERIIAGIEQALLFVAEAAHQYDLRLKLEAVNKARAGLARAAGLLLLAGGTDARLPPITTWLAVLEGKVIPAVAGYARWADRTSRGRR